MKTIKEVTQNEVRMIALISGDWTEQGKFYDERYPISDDYLSESELPKDLLKQVKEAGWSDKDGNVFFPEDFQPEPMMGNDGNVYLVANNNTPKEELFFDYVNRGYQLLKQSETAN